MAIGTSAVENIFLSSLCYKCQSKGRTSRDTDTKTLRIKRHLQQRITFLFSLCWLMPDLGLL